MIAVRRAATIVARNDRPRAANKSVRRSASCRRPLANNNNNANPPPHRPIVRKDAATKAAPPKSAARVVAVRVEILKAVTQRDADPKIAPKAKGANRVAVAVVVAAAEVAAAIAMVPARKGRPLRSTRSNATALNELVPSMIAPISKTATSSMPR